MAEQNHSDSDGAQNGTETRLTWSDYKDQSPDEAAEKIYRHIGAESADLIAWYWQAIRAKKKAALLTRRSAFVALLLGAVTQLYSGSIGEAALRLHYTQGSLTFLAIAALLVQCDRSFGWTSGWTRYVTTVMKMESLTSEFKLTWARYLVSNPDVLTRSDVATLFDLAGTLEAQLHKIRDEETGAWAAEFDAGLQVLESAIRSQRESTEKKIDELRATVDRREAENAAEAKASLGAQKTGAMEISLKFGGPPRRVQIRLDQGTPEELLATSWSRVSVAPGPHQLEVTTLGASPVVESRIVDVAPGATARLVIEVPEAP